MVQAVGKALGREMCCISGPVAVQLRVGGGEGQEDEDGQEVLRLSREVIVRTRFSWWPGEWTGGTGYKNCSHSTNI